MTTAQTAYTGLKEQAIASYPGDKTLIHVGTASCGLAAGAREVEQAFSREIKKRSLDAEVKEAGCMGFCYTEPLVVIAKPGFAPLVYGGVDEGLVERLVQDFLSGDDPCYEYTLAALEPNDVFPTLEEFPRGVIEQKLLLKNCGMIDPLDINDYIRREGYAALARSLDGDPEKVLEEIKQAYLRGRGGAGFPAGIKWEHCRNTPAEEHYVICNADEGDPGAFMDRSLLESNPHLVIEGMLLAAYAVGANRGYFYIRAEYPLAIERINYALLQARNQGLLGENILGTGFSCQLEVFEGAGAFVCGEATALVRSMEGKPGLPQTRPPRLAECGFRGQPTLLNNVKTFAFVPGIIHHGAGWFKTTGTEENPGTAVFALVGKVNQAGLAEVPMGTDLRTLIFDVGEGIPGNKELKAVQIGGPSGGCLPESALDLPIDFDSLDEAGAIMGSGGLVVMDEDDCMVAVARYFLEFTRQESCGKCTFCRLGTKHMLDIITRITRGEGLPEDLEKLQELAEDVQMGSLCNLGKTAPNPVLTTLRYFREEYRAHIEEGRCPSGMCKDLIAYFILPERCSKLCSACVGSCPTEAIYTRDDGLKAIDQEKCVKCDNCMKACPEEYHAVVKLSPPHKLKEYERM